MAVQLTGFHSFAGRVARDDRIDDRQPLRASDGTGEGVGINRRDCWRWCSWSSCRSRRLAAIPPARLSRALLFATVTLVSSTGELKKNIPPALLAEVLLEMVLLRRKQRHHPGGVGVVIEPSGVRPRMLRPPRCLPSSTVKSITLCSSG